MRKLKYIFLFAIPASVIFFAGCLKSGSPIAGPTGTTGATGAPGGDLPYYHTIVPLSTASFTGAGPAYTYNWVFNGYDPKISYSLNVYVSKLNLAGQAPIWQQLPYPNVYQPPPLGDVLSASLTKDTVTITYTSTSGAFPTDSSMECSIIFLRQPY